jgi:Ca2+-binding RTX toxin-like protein
MPISLIEYALMAGHAYFQTRDANNLLPVPATEQGSWNQFFPQSLSSGFQAVSYLRGNEIVIAYGGTDEAVDWLANAGLASGGGSNQLRQAAAYYLQVRAANPTATITLTGHSLGGGLASLIGVFFDLTTFTFDQAPFINSATTTTRDDLIAYLGTLGYSPESLAQIAPSLTTYSTLASRQGRVTDYNVKGEFLSLQMLQLVGSILGIGRIGQQVELSQGTPDLSLWIDLHSQTLLTAFLQNVNFEMITFQMPDVLRLIFSSDLYKKDVQLPNTEQNFIEKLVLHQAGSPGLFAADRMLDRFTSDLQKVGQEGGLTLVDNNLTKALIGFAMQMYYEKTTSATKTLFSDVTGGIRFDRNDVADTLANAKGYTLYFTNYLTTLPQIERDLITQRLPDLLDWFIQAGGGVMVAMAANRGAFMLGGSGNDRLTGSSQADVLVGGAGNDVLASAGGDDVLIGGNGVDTYVVGAGNSRIVDADRRGLVLTDTPAGRLLASTFIGISGQQDRWQALSSNLTLAVTDTWKLLFDGGSIDLGPVLNDADFGIHVWQARSTPEVTRTITGDQDNSQGTDSLGNPIGVAVQEREDRLYGGRPASAAPADAPGDKIVAGGGNDVILSDRPNESADNGLGNADWVLGGDGRDDIDAGPGNDLVEGGADGVYGGAIGGDLVYSAAGEDQIYGDARISLQDAIAETGGLALPTGQQGDFLSGGADDDWLIGSRGNDALFGGGGRDLIIGGAGDDNILGDGGEAATIFTWSVTRTNTFGIYVATISGAAILDTSAGGADVIYAGSGNDWIYGGVGDDFIDGGTGNDVVLGDSGNDVVVGGPGDDVLVGGAGKDTYIFNAGDGRDQLFDDSTGIDGSVFVFGAGYDPNNMVLRPGSMVLDFGATGSIELQSFNPYDANAAAAFETVLFADGTMLSFDDVISRGFLISGTEGNDNGHDASHPVLAGTAFKDKIYGLGGNDELQGLQGNDVLDGGLGDDRLFGMDGDDELQGGDGSDALRGGDGNDLLIGGAGRDGLLGEAGDDTLDGGDDGGLNEFDLLYGGPGDDTYVYHAADSASDFSGASTITFGGGITSADLELRRTFIIDGYIVYKIGLPGMVQDLDRMQISVSSDDQLAAFVFADGTILDHEALLHETWVDPQTIIGASGDDYLDG